MPYFGESLGDFGTVFEKISAKNLLKMHGWMKISPLKCVRKHKKKLTSISPHRIGRNFGNLLVFVSVFLWIITGQMGILGPKFNFKKRGGDVFKVNLLPDKICCRWQGENGMVKKPWKCASLQRKNGRSKRWVATHNVNWMPDAFFREPRSFFSI